MESSSRLGVPRIAQSPTGPTVFDLVAALREYWWVLVISTVFIGALAAISAFYMQPVYRATAVLAPLPEVSANLSGEISGGFGDISRFLGGRSQQGPRLIDRGALVLQSQAFIQEFVEEHALLPLLYPDLWDDEHKRWTVQTSEEVPNEADAYHVFIEDILTVKVDDDLGTLEIFVDWTDPATAADWTSLLIEKLNAQLKERAISEAKRSLEYLNREIGKTSIVGVREALYRLIETQVKSVMLANSRSNYAFEVLSPPVAPELDRFVRPKRGLMVAAGIFFGLTAGALIAVTMAGIKAARLPAS